MNHDPEFIREKVELSQHTWWKVGGKADFFCLPESVDQVEQALLWAEQKSVPVTVLGGGSNVLISDNGVEGLVIGLKYFSGVEKQESNEKVTVLALAGTSKAEVLKVFLKAKLAPALFLCGLPGDMGGGVVMNAGVSEKITPREFCEIVDWFEVTSVDKGVIKKQKFTHSDVQWMYRSSKGWQPGVVTRVQVAWPNEPDLEIPQKVKQATRSRIMRQPLNMPSCGSVFKNPKGHASGALIEQSGLKGFQLGGAQVSEKHANFIVNLGNAKASEIHQIIVHVQQTVRQKLGMDLETEVKYIGRW